MLIDSRFRSGHFVEGREYAMRRPRGGAEWLLILTVDGAGVHRGRSTTARLPPHSAMLYAPGTPQWYLTDPATGSWELLWAHFAGAPRFTDLTDWPRNRDGVGLIDTADAFDRVRAALDELVDLQREGLPQRPEFVLNALERTLLWCDTVNPRSPRAMVDRRVRTVLDAIARTLGSRMSLRSLAAEAGVSPTRLSHLFKSEVGMSIPGYIESRRLQWAQDLLRMSDQPVSQIARQTGWNDPLYFSRRFSRAVGCSPTVWRKRLAANTPADADVLSD